VAVLDARLAEELFCTPAEVEERVLEPLSDMLLEQCDAREDEPWPSCRCCGRPAHLVEPLIPVQP
jgi:hypothetical protein